uniref:Unkown protein n=1 Tax=Riptortus pedestris TaxID=329032 RepID=R4WDM4_RIPPE|nr:unkown protein [Riptortus pedestris]
MFTIRPYSEEDRDEVNRILEEVYYPEEPLTRANNLSPEPALASAVLPQGHSYIAASLDGKIVGLALNDEPPQVFPTIYTNDKEDVKFREMFAYMENVSGVLEAAPGAMEVRMMAVDGGWRGRGVATALLDAARKAAQDAGCPYIKLYCTSNHSSRLMSKLGWKLQYSMDYRDYLAHRPSAIVLPPEPHLRCNLYIDTVAGVNTQLQNHTDMCQSISIKQTSEVVHSATN